MYKAHFTPVQTTAAAPNMTAYPKALVNTHGDPTPPTGQHHSHVKTTKEKARGPPGTYRAQQSTTGKPSTPCENPDTAPPTIRSTLVLPKEGENRRQTEATKDNQPLTNPPNKDLDPNLDISLNEALQTT